MPSLFKKSLDPQWLANPLLGEVREALREIDHIRHALKELEAKAQIPVPNRVNIQFDMALRSSRLDGWLASLNESYVAMQFLVMDAYAIAGGDGAATNYLKAELDKAEDVWGGAFKKARHKAAARKAKAAAAARDIRGVSGQASGGGTMVPGRGVAGSTSAQDHDDEAMGRIKSDVVDFIWGG